MSTIEPILYANGALRLTDHGPRGGGIVLKHVGGKQVDIPYLAKHAVAAHHTIMPLIDGDVEAMVNCNYEPSVILDQIGKRYGKTPH